MQKFDHTTVQKLVFVAVLILALIAGLVIAEAVSADKPAHNGSPHGNGGRPDHAGGKADRNDPDDNGKGPDRGEGERDDTDRNNGCGNDSDRTDDCEGWCGRKPKPMPTPLPPTPKPPTNIRPIEPIEVCKLALWGATPEVFEFGVDVHNGANEMVVIAEAHGYLEVTFPLGFKGTVLWYRGNHATSLSESFECNASELVLWEPLAAELSDLIE